MKEKFLKTAVGNLKYFHFGLLIILVINYLFGHVSGVQISSNAVLIIKIIFYLSGISLFFISLKPFKWLTVYFSLFTLPLIATILYYISDKIAGVILIPFFLFFFNPSENVATYNNYFLRKNFGGVMGPCCSYSIYKGNLLFEKKILDFMYKQSLHDMKDFKVESDHAEITYKEEVNFDNDTTIILKFK